MCVYIYICIYVCVRICKSRLSWACSMCAYVCICIYVCICMCACVCVYVYVYIYTHIHIYIHISICIYTYICICIHIYKNLYIHINVHKHMIYMYIYTCIYVYIYVHVCMYIYSSSTSTKRCLGGDEHPQVWPRLSTCIFWVWRDSFWALNDFLIHSCVWHDSFARTFWSETWRSLRYIKFLDRQNSANMRTLICYHHWQQYTTHRPLMTWTSRSNGTFQRLCDLEPVLERWCG